MSDHILFNLLNKLEKEIHCNAQPSILSLIAMRLINSIIQVEGTKLLDFICHMTLKPLCNYV